MVFSFSFKHVSLSLLCVGMIVSCMACGTAGRGGGTGNGAPDDPEVEATGGEKTTEGSAEANSGMSDGKAVPEDIEGDWVMVYYENRTEYEDGDLNDYITMCNDIYADSSEIRIHKEGDAFVADYRYKGESYNEKIYGNKLTFEKMPAYEGCANESWRYSFSKTFEDDVDKIITMVDNDTLVEYESYASDPIPEMEDALMFNSKMIATYLRKDSPRLENLEDLRYFDTVTVSSTKELLGNIKNNTKVILNEGTYNLSEVFLDAKTRFVDYEYNQYQFEGVSNLCLEAAEGAKVLICVSDAYAPVMTFTEECSNITLRGLTIGHDVEPGTCSGSVVKFDGCSGISIEKCDLYGCGTYGVEATYCSNINVADSVIHDCTYGLVSLISVMDARFTGCEMYGSKGFEMIDLTDSYDVTFDGCNIHDNDSSQSGDGVFVKVDDYPGASFENCQFSNNTYKKFSTYSVSLERCNVNDNVP